MKYPRIKKPSLQHGRVRTVIHRLFLSCNEGKNNRPSNRGTQNNYSTRIFCISNSHLRNQLVGFHHYLQIRRLEKRLRGIASNKLIIYASFRTSSKTSKHKLYLFETRCSKPSNSCCTRTSQVCSRITFSRPLATTSSRIDE